MAHSGFMYQTKDAIGLAKKTDRFLLEISAMCGIAVTWVVNGLDPHKVVFGSDGPVQHPIVEMAKIEVAKPTEEDRKLILGENLARILGPHCT